MVRSFRLIPSNNSTSARALIPKGCTRDLVEYIGNHGVRAHYSFSPDGFVVSFPHMDSFAARELLKGWAGIHRRARDHADASPLLV